MHSVGLAIVAYLIKPVAPEVLSNAVSHAVERSRYFRAVVDTRVRLNATCEDLDRIETSMHSPAGEASTAPLLAFLDLSFRNIAGSLRDLKQRIETMAASPKHSSDLEWLQTARPLVMLEALRETISVLEKTKGSFKSRELGDLRKKLASLISEPSTAPGTDQS